MYVCMCVCYALLQELQDRLSLLEKGSERPRGEKGGWSEAAATTATKNAAQATVKESQRDALLSRDDHDGDEMKRNLLYEATSFWAERGERGTMWERNGSIESRGR